MSVEQIALVLHHSKARGTDKVVLLGIANHAGDGGAWPTIDTLVKYANVTERVVQTSIKKLVASGELLVDRNGGGTMRTRGNNRPNMYTVLVTCPVTCDHSVNHRPRPYPVAAERLSFTTSSPVDIPVDTGVMHTAPLGARGAADSTARGAADSTQTIHVTNPSTAVGYSTTDRAPERAGDTCDTCSKSPAVCRRLYADDHPFVSSLSKHEAKP